MKSAQEWFDEYGESHRNRLNKAIHWICVPAIFFSIIGFLVSIPHAHLSNLLGGTAGTYFNYGSIAILLGMFFYASISAAISIGMLLFSALVLWGTVQLEQAGFMQLWLLSLIVFVTAWVGQFIGHYIEGAKPSFFKDLQFLLIGPAWLMGFVYKRLGLKY